MTEQYGILVIEDEDEYVARFEAMAARMHDEDDAAITIQHYACNLDQFRKQCDQLEAENKRLLAVVRHAYVAAKFIREYEWYVLPPTGMRLLKNLQLEAGAALAKGDRECPTIPLPAHVASVAPRLLSGTEYRETVAAIAQWLSGKLGDAPPDSLQTKSEQSPSVPLINSCGMEESVYDCSQA